MVLVSLFAHGYKISTETFVEEAIGSSNSMLIFGNFVTNQLAIATHCGSYLYSQLFDWQGPENLSFMSAHVVRTNLQNKIQIKVLGFCSSSRVLV
jgi:hypothetical protein